MLPPDGKMDFDTGDAGSDEGWMSLMTEAGVDVLPAIELIDGMPGFPDVRTFGLVSLDDAGLLYSLRSLENPELRFLVVPPAPFFPSTPRRSTTNRPGGWG